MKLSKAQEQGENGTCDTVRVEADNEYGYAVINAHDFDEKKHKKYVEPKPKEAKESAKDKK